MERNLCILGKKKICRIVEKQKKNLRLVLKPEILLKYYFITMDYEIWSCVEIEKFL